MGVIVRKEQRKLGMGTAIHDGLEVVLPPCPVVPTLNTPILASPSPWSDIYCGPLPGARNTSIIPESPELLGPSKSQK